MKIDLYLLQYVVVIYLQVAKKTNGPKEGQLRWQILDKINGKRRLVVGWQHPRAKILQDMNTPKARS